MDRKWPGSLSIPYFQAHTNTYAPLPILKQCFEEALGFERVVGLSIATRADCISVKNRRLPCRAFQAHLSGGGTWIAEHL